MKNINRIALSIIMASAVALSATVVRAALIPTLILGLGNNNSQVQVTVLGADPNASATLYYPSNGAYAQFQLPGTDGNGRISYLVGSSISPTAGGLAYVVVNGAQSQTQVWPTVTGTSPVSSSGLTLSQNYLSVTQGQSAVVTASGGNNGPGTLSVPANTNTSVAYVSSISGVQVTVVGVATGSATLTVCGANIGCTSLYVTVLAPSSSPTAVVPGNSSAISLNPTSLTLNTNESRTVTLSGPGSYYISAHTNPGAVSTGINGSLLTVRGLIAGTDTLSVCGTSGSNTSCSSLSVTVNASTAANTSSQGTISFSQSQLDLSVGQSQTVTVTGSGLGSFYISNNTNPTAVSANLTGNSIVITGNAPGGANVTVCQLGGVCADVYGFVPISGSSGAAAVQTASAANLPLALSSFNISSNNVGNTFMGAGTALTFVYKFNQTVSSQSVSLGGQAVTSFGSGSGPYTAIYTMTGNEGAPVTVSLSYSNANGASGRTNFTFGPATGAGSGSGSGTAASTAASSGAQTFTRYLEVGSTGSDVTALQMRLTALGVYSGPITGKFGAQTEAAVKKYQAKHGLTQLGAVGPATRGLLNQGL